MIVVLSCDQYRVVLNIYMPHLHSCSYSMSISLCYSYNLTNNTNNMWGNMGMSHSVTELEYWDVWANLCRQQCYVHNLWQTRDKFELCVMTSSSPSVTIRNIHGTIRNIYVFPHSSITGKTKICSFFNFTGSKGSRAYKTRNKGP